MFFVANTNIDCIDTTYMSNTFVYIYLSEIIILTLKFKL